MSRPARTLERLERILTMVPWLLEHPGARVPEVCERFGVSREELTADLDILGYCGLPGYGGGDLVEVSVVGERITVRMADFFRRPLRLSLREALTLLLAARALSGVSALPESDALRSAEGKLTDLLARAAGEEKGAGEVGPRIAVDLTAAGDEFLPVLRQAIEERHVVRLTYRSGSTAEVTERDVEPWGLTGSLGSWYVQGYCRKAQGPRAFRLDRVRALEVTGDRADPRARPSGVPAPVYEPGPDDERVVLDLERDAWWVSEWAVVDDVRDRGGVRRVTLRTARREWIARLVLAVGEGITIVEPEDLRESVRALARTVLERYRPDKRASRTQGGAQGVRDIT